jgi:CrcB protein
MIKYLWIWMGAALGASCRYWLANWTSEKWGTHFAYGTWIINLIGSFILGWFLFLNLERGVFQANTRYFLAIGWCASFTTFSTFSWETFRYFSEGNITFGFLNILANVLGCLLATWAGVVVARLF